MKKLYLIGNMKMNMSYAELEPYFEKLTQIASTSTNVVGVCVPSVYLDLAKYALEGSKVLYGAENMHYEDKGAFTGEISADMIMDFNSDLVILGHSERRQYFNETNKTCNLKMKALEAHNMNVIYCVGESLEDYESGKTKEVIKTQVLEGIEGLGEEYISNLTIAYEPVWSIGTGKNASKEIASEICAYIIEVISEKYGEEVASGIYVLYGGSVKPNNIKEYLDDEHIDGALIGGASLNAESFIEMITNVEE